MSTINTANHTAILVLIVCTSRFNAWVTTVHGRRSVPRYACCIYGDAESIQSVIHGDAPGSTSGRDISNPRAFVKLIDHAWTDEIEQLDPDDFSDEEELRRLNAGDEGYPPIDGCRQKDVGWMKVATRKLITRACDLLRAGGWLTLYVRPPAIQSN